MKKFLIAVLVGIVSFSNPLRAEINLSRGESVKPDHVVVVIEENKSFEDIIGNKEASYINHLAGQGALMMKSYAVAHPSLPNYLALFSGSTHGIKDDGCEYVFMGGNLAQSLQEKGLSFKTFSETMPDIGFARCKYLAYRKKHNPAAYFPDLPGTYNQRFADFPSDFTKLPTISFVVPNQDNDMHDGTIAQADAWLKKNMDAYIQWAQKHNSLLVLTWDEDDNTPKNHIATIILGDHVKPGRYKQHIDHYDVLKTLAEIYSVKAPNKAEKAKTIRHIWID